MKTITQDEIYERNEELYFEEAQGFYVDNKTVNSEEEIFEKFVELHRETKTPLEEVSISNLDDLVSEDKKEILDNQIEEFLIEECGFNKYEQLVLNEETDKIRESLEQDFNIEVSEEDLVEQFSYKKESIQEEYSNKNN